MALKFIGDRDNMYVYPWYISDLTATKDLEKIVGHKVKEVFVVIEKGFFSFYYEYSSSAKIGLEIYKRICSDKAFFRKVISNVCALGDDLMTFGRTVEKTNVRKLSDRELLALYEIYIKKLRSLRAWGWIPVFLDGLDESFLSVRVQADLNRFFLNNKINENSGPVYSLLSSSKNMSEVGREEYARLKLLAKLEDEIGPTIMADIKAGKKKGLLERYPAASKLISRHLKDYGWLTYAYAGPVMDFEYLFDLLHDNVKKGEIKKQMAEIEAHFNGIEAEKKAAIKRLSIPDELAYLFEVSSELMFLKDHRKGTYQKSYVFMDKVMAELAKRLRLDFKEIKYLNLDEVKLAIRGKLPGYQEIAKLRTEKCCYYVKDGEMAIYEGIACEKMIEKYVKVKKTETADSAVKELKGMTAYGGQVKGTVKIVLVKADVSKVKEGDVLVSSATNPDLIVAMKKAGAFVTDSGGITSHAAIVSRELRKPCVVGTKLGTKILKDGDLVEVDANKGIVRKLN